MTNPNAPESRPAPESGAEPAPETNESFDAILSQFEQSHSRKGAEGGKGLIGTVITVNSESVLLDIGFKTEGILPLTALASGEVVKPGDKLPVNVKGRDPEGYYELSRGRVRRPTDWTALEQAFTEKSIIAGTVTAVIKGGLSVDVGVRAFMPASRSGTRAAADMEKLVGQEIRCRIIKLDVTEEDVVVDRRAVAEEEERAGRQQRYAEIKEGETVAGTVRSLTDYGAFVDMGGIDALLHVGDIAWGRVNKPADVLSEGQQIDVQVLKISTEGGKRRISVGMKQLLQNPWHSAADKYKPGERVRGTVTRVLDFGAFVELEPGVEGLIHLSEMSWAKKGRRPSDVVKPGENVEAVILGVNPDERRISLGLKQTLGDPWVDAAQKFAVGSVIEGPVTSLTKFGAFVQLAEGVEGMIHISEISADKRINHPQDVLRSGQQIRAQVLAIDKEKRQFKLSIKQMAPTGLDEYVAEHKQGDVVTGRLIEVSGAHARVELGEGVQATCRLPEESPAQKGEPKRADAKVDLSSLSSMLSTRWKGGAPAGAAANQAQSLTAGQIRSFRIARLDAAAKKIDLELA